jgi:hypothetical protein
LGRRARQYSEETQGCTGDFVNAAKLADATVGL